MTIHCMFRVYRLCIDCIVDFVDPINKMVSMEIRPTSLFNFLSLDLYRFPTQIVVSDKTFDFIAVGVIA